MTIIASALNYWFDGRTYRYIFTIFLASLFHKTAILFVLLVISFKLTSKNIKLTLLSLSIIFFVIYFISPPGMLNGYYLSFTKYMQSNAAHLKGIFYLIPAILFLIFKNRIYKIDPDKYDFYEKMSYFMLVCYGLLFLHPFFYNALDRVFVYLIPFEALILGATLPAILNKAHLSLYVALIFGYKFLVFVVWMTYAHTSSWFVPYKFLY